MNSYKWIVLLSLDIETDLERTNRVWASHLARAKWMTEQGYRHLLRGGAAHLSVFGAPHARTEGVSGLSVPLRQLGPT